MYSMDILNGSQPAFPGQPFNGGKTNTVFEAVDPSTFDDDSDDELTAAKCTKHGKKTKGKVKIKMEFIENKLRRNTTFSKRKTGIMKKAYELATLIGTQVMLLVASETGHVYTFATRKLQPMITSESGKALIQTCLNSPDPPPVAPGQQQAVDQRMKPGGFEETELACSVDEENEKMMFETASGKPLYTITSSGTSDAQVYMQATSTPQGVTSQQSHQTQVQSQPVVSSSPVVTSKNQHSQNSIAVHMPGLPQGFFLQPGTFTIQTTQTGSSTLSQQTVYRIPGTSQQIITSGPLLTTNQNPQTLTNGSPGTSQCTVSLVSQGNQQTSPALTPSVFMYQTPQGIVYSTGSLPDKFNFQQVTSQDSAGNHWQGQTSVHGQPIIIPMPVSLPAGSQQVLQFSTESVPVTEVSQPVTGAKKRKV
ncbi:serum response factor-like isoform X4 [Dreissena polymorpha]|uniref:serum response factor-like isoform X4 n=1 Tax=Dreissena polymorpha TaxID=45954 RepID=UPI002264D000|nr:serum response factor-like isoform X4 [Dreissena polymorpha]